MLRHRTGYFVRTQRAAVAFFALFATACGRSSEPAPGQPPHVAPAGQAAALADAYLNGYFDRNPDAVTQFGVPGRHHDRLPDNSFDALKAWQAKEDAWLVAAKGLNPDAIEAPVPSERTRVEGP